ncbi:MAG TPA: cation diffusion facilitator family transporter [Chloroflexota bacterium]
MQISAAADKYAVALASVVAAVCLTVLKLVVGLSTGSLGILAEAAHSASDLIAALLTLLAVNVADREADESHPYGHGRFENLSALFETGLLLVTCGWVAWEAVQRLLGGSHRVEASFWAFAVMAISIVVDWSRSRALSRAAREHGSQALEADALHFSSDIWSSAVVMLGLGLVWLAERQPDAGWLEHADAVAALFVSAIVVRVGLRLGHATVDALADRAPPGVAGRIRAAALEVDGVLRAERIRVRRVGNKLFLDLTVAVDRTLPFARAHDVADAVEERVRGEVPGADVVVHVEPVATPSESAAERVHFVARQRGVGVHDVRVRQVGDRFEVDLHVELDPSLNLIDAHRIATELEQALLAADPRLGAVNTHLEAPTHLSSDVEITRQSPELVGQVRRVADRLAGPGSTHEVRVYRPGSAGAGERNLVLHASFPAELDLDQVHQLSAEIERALRRELPDIGTVLVHAEPRGVRD